MNFLRMFHGLVGVLLTLLLTGCSYHGQIRRSVYPSTPAPTIFNASVLIIQPGNVPDSLTISDPTSQALYDFSLDIKESVYSSTADMLKSSFTQVQTGPKTQENQFDLIADISLTAELTRSDCTSKQPQLAARQNGLCTELTLSLRPAGKAVPLQTFSARRFSVFEKPGASAVIRALNKWTLYILSPILLPTYTQLQGNQLRKQFQTQLQDMLGDLQKQIQTQEDFLPTR